MLQKLEILIKSNETSYLSFLRQTPSIIKKSPPKINKKWVKHLNERKPLCVQGLCMKKTQLTAKTHNNIIYTRKYIT